MTEACHIDLYLDPENVVLVVDTLLLHLDIAAAAVDHLSNCVYDQIPDLHLLYLQLLTQSLYHHPTVVL